MEGVAKKILQSGGPASTGTRARYVKWFDDKVTFPPHAIPCLCGPCQTACRRQCATPCYVQQSFAIGAEVHLLITEACAARTCTQACHLCGCSEQAHAKGWPLAAAARASALSAFKALACSSAEHVHRRLSTGWAGDHRCPQGPRAVCGPVRSRREGRENQRRGGGTRVAQPAAPHAAAGAPQQGAGEGLALVS